MDLAEALLALGVGGVTEWQTLSAEALKRAYLKRVRAHPPERDPQGFQRVREAYELLQGLASAQASLRPSPRAEAETRVELERPREERPVADSAAVSSALDRFQQALTAEQFDAAADALLEIYADVTLVSSRPSPNQALFLITKQFVLGEHDRGRRLFLAFEQHMARMNSPLNERLAASWKLLAELALLSAQVPPRVTCALAGGIESGDFAEASEALRVEIDDRRLSPMELEDVLEKSAPALHAAAWPTARRVSEKQQRADNRWGLSILALGIVLVGSFLNYISHLTPASRAAESPTAAASTPNGGRHLRALDDAQFKVLFWGTRGVEKLVIFKRCDQLHAAWADYTSLVRSLKEYESVMPGYEKLRLQAILNCPQLEGELPKSP